MTTTKKKETEKKKTVICQYANYATLTVGNRYEIIDEEDNKYFVIDDKGKKTSFYKSRFK